MANYLTENYDFSDRTLVATLDEFSLWSAPFGLKLLECVRMRKGINVLDIGFGTGFPLLEVAQRLGESSHVFGIDPWDAAIERVNQKINFYRLKNVSIQHAVAEEIPFSNEHFDLLISNNGLNNVEELDKTLEECHRVLRPEAQMVITMNLPNTFVEFYTIFKQTLSEMGMNSSLKSVDEHIFDKRKSLEYWQKKLITHGFETHNEILSSFSYRFTDGTALLNYSFFKICFLDGWKSCVDNDKLPTVFERLEHNLNAYAQKNDGIELSVPFVCFDLIRH